MLLLGPLYKHFAVSRVRSAFTFSRSDFIASDAVYAALTLMLTTYVYYSSVEVYALQRSDSNLFPDTNSRAVSKVILI